MPHEIEAADSVASGRKAYAAIFIDAIIVKVRDGQVANRPIYGVIGVTLVGETDILGLWAGSGGGLKFWMSVLIDLRHRGSKDVFFVVCDGLKGLPEVFGNVWPAAIVQTCIVRYSDTVVMPIPARVALVGGDDRVGCIGTISRAAA
jgi:transposase-like protein